MELIRYCKNKSAMLSVIATVFLFLCTYLVYRAELLIVMEPAIDSESSYYTIQTVSVQALVNVCSLLMEISVILTTTAYYKNRIYYNVNGAISSRFKLFIVDLTVLFVIASVYTAVIMAYSFFISRFMEDKWLFGQGDRVMTFAVISVFSRMFFCMLGGYALSHLIRSGSRTIAAALGLQALQNIVFFATMFCIATRLDEFAAPNPFSAVVSCLESPSLALFNYACGGYSVMTPVSMLATTSIPFAIIFIVAAVAAGRRIEV